MMTEAQVHSVAVDWEGVWGWTPYRRDEESVEEELVLLAAQELGLSTRQIRDLLVGRDDYAVVAGGARLARGFRFVTEPDGMGLEWREEEAVR